ncbi:SpdD protein [Streptomyces sp. NPDC008150]|uniref:SpdD protein n=1 Tax=Streptomyces sp. NPDC008150 TaxID=3364816 RepID=UPI0036F05BC4
MFTPKYPAPDTASGIPAAAPVAPPVSVPTAPAPAAPAPVSNRPVVQLTPGSTLALVGGGTAVVLVVGAVLVSMLLAVAITGASVAVCAVVLRSLLNHENRH